jgi:hypothetical protein
VSLRVAQAIVAKDLRTAAVTLRALAQSQDHR